MEVQELRAEIEARPTDPGTTRRFERARRDVVYDEITASCAIAGAHLSASATRRLLERGITIGGSLADHLLVLGYARAALGIARERPVHGAQRRLITVAEIQRLHVTITTPLDVARTPPAPSGSWRRANLPPIREGMVTLPHWLIEFEMSALVDRIGGGPAEGSSIFAWLADAYERLERIRPFVEANGRVARLVVNLLLAREGYPPATIAHALVATYQRALRSADAGDRAPLAELFERATRANLERLAATLVAQEALRPLAELTRPGAGLEALRKAAQRGRLRTIARGREILSTTDWVEAYLKQKSKAGRPSTRSAPRS
ncbi:MAG: Fic family protein [Candidatus Eremiobacteraeota bacterium]|nr:Fic family protein [Candidatus Eremiobacteraeota bacterium]